MRWPTGSKSVHLPTASDLNKGAAARVDADEVASTEPRLLGRGNAPRPVPIFRYSQFAVANGLPGWNINSDTQLIATLRFPSYR